MRYAADFRTLAFVLLYLTATVLAWLSPLSVFTPFWVFWVSSLAFFCVPIIHNTVHCPVFLAPWANRAFQIVLSFCFGHPVSAFVPGHNLSHHKFPGTDKDATRTSLMRFRWNLLNQLLMFFVCIKEINVTELRFKKRMKREIPAWNYQYNLEYFLVYGTKISLLFVDWQRGLLFILVPHLFAVWNLVNLNYWQHDGCDIEHKYNHSRNITGKLVNFFLFNNGFHGAHHMAPGLHWSLLPGYHEAHLAPFNHPNLNRRSLAFYLFESCIYPGERVTYEGKAVKLPEIEPKSQDWVKEVSSREFNFVSGMN